MRPLVLEGGVPSGRNLDVRAQEDLSGPPGLGGATSVVRGPQCLELRKDAVDPPCAA